MNNIYVYSKIFLKYKFHFYISRKFHISSIHCLPEDFNHVLKSMGNKFNISQIDQILSSGEEHVDVKLLIPECPVKEVFINQIGANIKIEDRWNVGVNQVNGEISSLVAGVVDGHSGKDCAQLINKAGLEYIAASFLNPTKLKKCLQEYHDTPYFTIVRRFHPGQWESLNDSVKALFKKSLLKYMTELVANEKRLVDPNVVMKDALVRLDNDMCIPQSKEDLGNWFQSRPLLRLSLSGAVALFLRIYWLGEEGESKPTIHVANVGDCEGIVIRLDQATKTLKAIPLSVPHTTNNKMEVQRLANAHKGEDPTQLIRDGRLLGELAPLRSFGDVRYKWPADWLKELHRSINLPGNMPECPKGYNSPPYLTAEPELSRHVLLPDQDKYIVVATDGLWDVLSASQVVDIVSKCPIEVSPATQLIKHALSNDVRGCDVQKLSMHLALKPGVARLFRDDITVMVFKL